MYYIANARMPTEKAHGIQLAKMAEAFIEQGIDLELVVPRRKTSLDSVRTFYGLRVDIPVKKIPVLDWYAYSRTGFFIGSLCFASGYFLYLLRKRLNGEQFIIYMTDIDQFSFFLIPFIGVRYVCEIHDAKPKRFLFMLLFRFAAGIITINTIIKKELSQTFRIADKKIMVYPNGIDMSMFASLPAHVEAKKMLGVDSDMPIVLYVGRFYSWKGLDTLIEAISILGEKNAYYFVGGTMQELIRASGIKIISQSIHCVGHRPFTEIPLWLAAADLLLVLGTKRNEYSYLHTSPMKFFEYMASKRPILASDTPANREIVSNREALLYEPDNVKDLAAKLDYALLHGDEMQERASNAFINVQDFSWEKRSKHIGEFILKRL